MPGLKLPGLTADICLCSHGHRDHCFAEAVRLTGRACMLRPEAADTFHDEKRGALRGKNTVYTVKAEGLRVTHMGDIGHIPDEKTLSEIGRPDVLMIPIGGFYTVDADAALETAKRLGARIVIPMHYRGKGFGYDNIAAPDEFLKMAENVVISDSDSIVITDKTPPMTAILKCPV